MKNKRNRVRPRKSITLDKFFNLPRKTGEKRMEKTKAKVEEKPRSVEGTEEKKQIKRNILDLIEVLFGEAQTGSEAIVKGKHGVVEGVVSGVEKGGGKEVIPEITEKAIIPTGRILDIILKEGLLTSETTCNSYGECSDGINVGEYFTDEYGFHRQRGFIRTTRIPIFMDWIVEDGYVEKVLPRAHKLVTNRDAVAIIPDDFLCELQARYGIILRNYDKCYGYRVSIIGGSSRKKR